jgi:transposase InsO family protein
LSGSTSQRIRPPNGSRVNNGGISLERGSALHDPGPGLHLGAIVTRRLRAMGVRDKPIAPASPWQNGFVERLVGSIRRECVDHIMVLSEAHLHRILRSYAENSSIPGQGCAGPRPGSANRRDQFTRHPLAGSITTTPGFSVHTGSEYAQATARRGCGKVSRRSCVCYF